VTTTLAIDTRRGRHCELRLTNETGDRAYAVGVFPVGSDTGICIGVGASAISALGDALDTLQAARWSLHDALVEAGKARDGVPQGRGTTGQGATPTPTGGGIPPKGDTRA
jgi:hypothetical protein